MRKIRKTTEQFIIEAINLHSNKYKYDKVIYLSAHTKCIIICQKHGEFLQTPNSHLKGYGCKKCARDYISNIQKIGNENFIERSNLIHNNKFNYSLIDYKNYKTKIKIICDKGHIFEQKPNEHLAGHGCPKCVGLYKTTDELIDSFRKKHNNTYDYSKVNYINNREKIIIICKNHGEFLQNPYEHSIGSGCPKCNTIGKKSEPALFNFIKNKFKDEDIISQGRPDWLKRQSLDIFFPKYNIAIEYQGKQHFKSYKFFGGDLQFNKTLERDIRKYNLCLENNCKLFYFTYQEKFISKDFKYKIYFNEEDIYFEISKYISSFKYLN